MAAATPGGRLFGRRLPRRSPLWPPSPQAATSLAAASQDGRLFGRRLPRRPPLWPPLPKTAASLAASSKAAASLAAKIRHVPSCFLRFRAQRPTPDKGLEAAWRLRSGTSVKRIHQFGAGWKRLNFHQTDILVLRLPPWLTEKG